MTETSLGDFFSRNSQLFTVLGVFGGIAVYITRLDVESRWQRLGVVSSLTIFILVALAIQRNVSPPSSDKEPFDFVVNQQRRKKGLVVFYVAFYAVVISVTAIVLRYSGTLIFLFQFLLTIGGIGVTRWYVSSIPDLQGVSPTVGEDKETVLYAAYLLRRSSYVMILGSGVLAIAWLQGMVPLQDLFQFQINHFANALIIGLASGAMAGGLLYTLMGISVLFLHFVFILLKEKNMLEEFSQYHNALWGSGKRDSE